MIWVLLSLLGGFSKSILDLLMKKFMNRHDEDIMLWGKFAFSVPFFLIALLIYGMPDISLDVSWVILVGFPLEMLGVILYFRAIKLSPLSLTIPFLGLSPILILLTSFLLLGEVPSWIGLIGIITVVFGIYTLGIKKDGGLLAPFLHFRSEKGSMLMVIVAAIFSLTPVFWKIGAGYSSVLFYGLCVQVLITITYTFMLLRKGKDFKIKEHFWRYVLLGFISVVEMVSVVYAMDYVIVNYAMSVKRSSILFSTVFGFLFFAERGIFRKMISVFLILLGIILVTFA